MLIKTSDLTGTALDWAVGYIMGEKLRILDRQIVWPEDYSPSTDWALGGPIIEREKCIATLERLNGGHWRVQTPYDATQDRPGAYYYGPTPLIAAMRCYVAAKWNDEVEIPEELKRQD